MDLFQHVIDEIRKITTKTLIGLYKKTITEYLTDCSKLCEDL